jgi:hypothetical protein
VITKTIETIATSRADDLAFRALADVARLTQGIDSRIVGGQMVGLLTIAYPTSAAVIRQTADADAAITTQVAASGRVHDLLTEAGYIATAGNSYEKRGQTIDLLVPSDGDRFARHLHGGRGFDAAPALHLVLSATPILASVNVMLTDASSLAFEVRLPSVELAIVLKAGAYASRKSAKDITDLHNLLQVAQAYDPETYGGWRLDVRGLTGARGDAQRILNHIADIARRTPAIRDAGVRPEVLSALIRSRVGAPRSS